MRGVVNIGNEDKKTASIMRTKKFRTIKADLLDQLERSGNRKEYYIDLVEDYMNLYITKIMLKEDVFERGVKVRYDNGGGQYGYKKNDSIEQMLKVNTQMLKILEALKITPEEDSLDEEDEL